MEVRRQEEVRRVFFAVYSDCCHLGTAGTSQHLLPHFAGRLLYYVYVGIHSIESYLIELIINFKNQLYISGAHNPKRRSVKLVYVCWIPPVVKWHLHKTR